MNRANRARTERTEQQSAKQSESLAEGVVAGQWQLQLVHYTAMNNSCVRSTEVLLLFLL